MQAESTQETAAALPRDRQARPKWAALKASVLLGPAAVLVAVALVTAAAAGWWLMRSEQEAARVARQAEVRAAGVALARTAEALLARDDVAGLQAAVQETAQSLQLKACRVVLANGTVLAASDVAEVTSALLPAEWMDKPGLLPPALESGAASAAAAAPFTVVGRGEGKVELAAGIGVAGNGRWQATMAAGAVALLLLGGMGAALVMLKRRLRGLEAVRGALLAIGEGETSFAASKVSDSFGPEAAAWNRVIQQNEALHQQVIADRTVDALSERRRGGGSGLESACDAMWQGLILIDHDMRAKYANGAAAVLLQSGKEELVGRDVATLFTDEKVLGAIKAAIDGAAFQRRTYEIERQHNDETGMLRVSIRPVRKGDPAAAIIIVEDITQLRAAEDARHAFVANASHELRTPLTNIRLYLESALEDNGKNPAMLAQALNVMNQETRRLERIVTDMLSVAEIEAGSFQLNRDDVPLEPIFADLETDFQAMAKNKQMTLRFNLSPKLPKLHGDRDKIIVALHNLVGNAIKYTPAGGTVDVNVEASEQLFSVAVKDNGIGIAEEELENVFQKFYRAKDKRIESVTGSGLGLALAREVVRLHGGDITVESQLNKGSTFTMRIPVQAKAA